MTAYCLRFLPQYSSTTALLRLLLRKDAQWAWTPACEAAVVQLKAQLIAPPVLAHFDPSSPTLLTCDASNYAVGAVVSQLHNGMERPIAFDSRALNSAEQKYSVGEREALACVWACERWHMYVYGRSFTLLTINVSNVYNSHRDERMWLWTRIQTPATWTSSSTSTLLSRPKCHFKSSNRPLNRTQCSHGTALLSTLGGLQPPAYQTVWAFPPL